MIGAYNLKIYKTFNCDCMNCYKSLGEIIYRDNVANVKTIVKDSTDAKGRLNALKMQRAMFPEVDADVFLSHSSSDVALAKLIAGRIQAETNQRVFIDSAFWGSMYELEYEINDIYSRIGEDLFSYQKCLHVASNTRMLLATALSRMVEKTPYFVFLNTRNALLKYNTTSPWIYYEIFTANQFLPKIKKAGVRLDEQHMVSFIYDLEKHIQNFNVIDIEGLINVMRK